MEREPTGLPTPTSMREMFGDESPKTRAEAFAKIDEAWSMLTPEERREIIPEDVCYDISRARPDPATRQKILAAVFGDHQPYYSEKDGYRERRYWFRD